MIQELLKEFVYPSSVYRGKPFWAWNGKLDPDELRWQIRIMHRMGLGGFLMHSRVGLATEYLSEEWFECVGACIDEAKKLGMEAWLYDEDRWPSGAAGGLATRARKYRMRFLTMLDLKGASESLWDRNTLAVFTAKIEGTEATNVRRIGKGICPKKLAGDESILVFRVQTAPLSSWYNGYTYLDTLSHEAVKHFIEITHENYRRKFGKHFSKTVPGIFTDEPNHGGKFQQVQDTNDGTGLPWTAKFLSTFKNRYGYDILSHLPELFLDVENRTITPARHDYHDCVTYLFTDAFSRQIAEWCERNRLKLTGHVLFEDTLSRQTSVVGSCMRFYEYMQVPGIDILSENRREYDTAKQVSSVARQFGRKWRITETYGITGWDFPFVGHKAIGDWQAVLGINLRCLHLSWYTMQGQCKRDYPASILHQSPWWELYGKVEDYFARIHVAMTKGEEVRDLLVIHPVESAWMFCRKGWQQDPNVQKFDQMLVDLRDSLLAANIDFDYGDEDILLRHGKVSKSGKITKFVVGKATYTAVVVPPLLTIRKSTLELLTHFRDSGGTVVFAGTVAEHVDAMSSKSCLDFADDCISTPPKGQALIQAVEASCRRVSITDDKGRQIAPILHLLREDKNAFYLFVCNVGHDFRKARKFTIQDLPVLNRKEVFGNVQICGFTNCKGTPIELDPQTGQAFQADSDYGNEAWKIRTTLPMLGSRLFVIPKKTSTKLLPKRQRMKDVRVHKLSFTKWDIKLSENNNLALDYPKYKIGSGNWRKAEDILRIDCVVRESLGIEQRSMTMVQPWAQKKSSVYKSLPVTLCYDFEVKGISSGDFFLCIEQPEQYKIFVNDSQVSTDIECGWWVDKSLHKIQIDPSLLHKGKNQVMLTCNYGEDHLGLESIYITGAFGTRVKGTEVAITKLPTSLKLGDWTKQGLAFYSGSISYLCIIQPRLKKGQRLFLEVSDYHGVAVRVLVNDKHAGVIAWSPNELDITDFIKKEEPIRLAIEVIGHRRNSHGPLHSKDKHFTEIKQQDCQTPLKPYYFVPCGLMNAPRLIVRE